MSRALCTKCGQVVGWSARRGVRLADFRHRSLAQTACDGKLTAWTEKTEARMVAHLCGLVDPHGRNIESLHEEPSLEI